MSLEAALEEERLEILKLLERPAGGRKSSSHPSGTYSTPSSPRQGYSSLARTTSPARQVTSLIDAVSELPIPSSGRRGPGSGTSSPGFPNSPPATSSGIYRTSSGPSNPRLLGQHRPSAGLTPNAEFNFNMMPSTVIGAGNPNNLKKGSHGRMGSVGARSRSPLAMGNEYRSSSPGAALMSPAETSRKLLTENGQLVDLDTAYARLNDEALHNSGGILETLPERRPVVDQDGVHVRASSGETVTSDGGLRLQKDLAVDEEVVAESSDDDYSDDESPGTDDEEESRGRRGRRSRTQSLLDGDGTPANSSDQDSVRSMLDIGVEPGGSRKKSGKKKKDSAQRRTMSLLAAAEEERKSVSSKYKVRSLLPSISVTPSSGPGSTSPTTSRRSGVHPSTSYDLPSAASTPVSSDQEADDLDIKRAQRMEMIISPIISAPESQRVIRTIIRGDYDSIHNDAENEKRRRPRKYLVATDLSSEAQYAMEWTIGTVLRDGDTLMAIYVADQESVDGGKPVTEANIEEALTKGEVSSQAHAAVQGSMTPPMHMGSLHHLPGTSSPLAGGLSGGLRSSDGGAERNKERTKAERERYTACEAITANIQKLLKKTRLQVKAIVEVIHCKSPKHLLTEIIDLSEPTLVVLGSRGRSALKGVLLGSFSNYLVTKSSVPVMVARKKLKHTKKYARTNVRLSNNLTSNTARILANAKVD